MNKLSIKSFTKDVSLNLIASAILTIVLQIIVYPFIGKSLDSQDFGTVITVMGIINIVALTIGGTLNNVRLVTRNDYACSGSSGDFNIILLVGSILGIIALVLILSLFGKTFNLIDVFMIVLILVLIILRLYLSVEFSLNIDYLRILKQSLYAAFGYLVGVFVVNMTKEWYYAFIFGEGCAVFYSLSTTKLLKEPFNRTSMFNSTIIKYLELAFSVFLGNALVYLDRLIIYPFLGGKSVGIYFAASLLGKTLGIIMIPIASVLLSYLAQSNKRITHKQFWVLNFFIIIISAIFFVVVSFIAPWVLKLLYPKLANEAASILNLANLAAIIVMAGSMCQPALLRFCNLSWQIIIQLLYGAVYFGGAMLLIKSMGVYGFCISAVIAAIVRLITMLIVGSIEFKD